MRPGVRQARDFEPEMIHDGAFGAAGRFLLPEQEQRSGNLHARQAFAFERYGPEVLDPDSLVLVNVPHIQVNVPHRDAGVIGRRELGVRGSRER